MLPIIVSSKVFLLKLKAGNVDHLVVVYSLQSLTNLKRNVDEERKSIVVVEQ